MTTNADKWRGCDIAVVGAGIVGLAVARELAERHPDAEIAVLEREQGPARHQTGHSSGVIHAGVYYAPGSLKARLCVDGARRLYAYCERNGIATRRSGKLIVATAEAELGRLGELERRGKANGIDGIERVDGTRIREIEPGAAGMAALWSPNTGVVDFSRVAASMATDAARHGVSIRYATAVGDLRELNAGYTVACAGAWSDRLAVAAGAPKEPRIVPFRGAYRRLRPERRELVRGLIYPVPDPELPFLGAHLTREINGEVLLGPSALMVAARDAYRLWKVRPRDIGSSLAWPGTWKMMRHHWRTGIEEIGRAASSRTYVAEAARLVPGLEGRDLLPGPAGVRAQAVARDGTLVDDFVLSETEHALHVRNAPSPAATASLALAAEIADRVDARLGA